MEAAKFYRIDKLESCLDKEATTRGWIQKIQKFPKHWFLILRDGPLDKDKVQIYVPNRLTDQLTVESYIEVRGKVQKLPPGKYSYQPFEVSAESVTVISIAKSDFPSKCPVDASSEVQLTRRHLYIRTEDFAAITMARAMFLRAIRTYFDDSGCTEIVPPCFVGNQCEGGATLFKVDHVGQEAYLTQSSQFYLEFAVPAVGDCYCIYPSFRAEKSHTRRHLSEFLHAEAEWRDVKTMEEHIKKLRDMMVGILSEFLKLDDSRGILTKLGRRKEIEEVFDNGS